jgi:hypothetical protein
VIHIVNVVDVSRPTLLAAGCAERSPATAGLLLRPGTTVRANDALLVLQFADGSLVTVARNTVIRLNPQGNGIHVVSGRVAVKRDIVHQALEVGTQTPFVTKSPTAEVNHLDTIYEVSYDPATDATTVRAIEGRLVVTPANTSLSPIQLATGEQVLVTSSDISGISSIGRVAEDPFLRLVQDQSVPTSEEGGSGSGTVVFLLVGLLVLGIVGASIAVMSAQRAPATRPAIAETATGVAADPPGWYPDPTGEARMRYWDGIRWTESTSG